MNWVQITALTLLCLFYIAYFVKALMLKRRGIAVNLLGKGEKPPKALIIEHFLRIATLIGAVVQFASVMFPGIVWSVTIITPIHIIGIVFMFVGSLFFITAIITMRGNWRAGFNSNQNTNLVTSGIYSISRNPAFVGFDFIYIGCAIAFPNVVNITVTIIAVILFHIQILGEEKYCADAFGQKYLDYKARTMRYIGKRPYKLINTLKSRAKQLKTDVPAVFIALKRKETPLLAKILAALTVAYALSPIDIIPDFIPAIGFLDDVLILPVLVAVIVKIIPKEVFAECRNEAKYIWADGKPQKWYYALPIILVWLLIIFIIIKIVWLC